MEQTEYLVESARDLVDRIHSAPDPTLRMRACRGALALGQDALSKVQVLSPTQITEVQAALRVAYRESRGACQTHLQVARLARADMQAAGVESFPLQNSSRAKTVPIASGTLALSPASDVPHLQNRADVFAANAEGRCAVITVGHAGRFSLLVRVLSGETCYLDPKECARELDQSPEFALNLGEGGICFGPAEMIERGTQLDAAPGRYACKIFCLRGGRGLRFIATLVRSDRDLPKLREPIMLKVL